MGKGGAVLGMFLLVFLSSWKPPVSAGLVEEIRNITHVLKPSTKEVHVDEKFDFQMFCRLGDRKSFMYYFRTATLRIISSAEDLKLMKGSNPREVYNQYTQSTKWLLWIANVLPWRARDTNFPTFNTSCVGISTSRPYSAMLIIRPMDPFKVLVLVAGITIFFLAPKFSKSTVFFYSSGTLLGAVAAALVFLLILSRVLPKGRSGYFALSVLWTLAFYFAGESYKRLEELIHEKLPYVVVYLVSGAIIAFLACYRWGPPAHPKTLNILRWALQIGGLTLVHFSSDFVEMSTAIILMLIFYNNTSEWISYRAVKYWHKIFPAKQVLLTEEEYIEQGAVETEKGLADLRTFCNSPDSNPWKLVTKLKDPRRFSSFIAGTSHLSDDELLAYESDEELDITTIRPRLARQQVRQSLPASSPFSPPRNSRLSYTARANQSVAELMTDDDDDDEADTSFGLITITDDED